MQSGLAADMCQTTGFCVFILSFGIPYVDSLGSLIYLPIDLLCSKMVASAKVKSSVFSEYKTFSIKLF